MAQNDLQKFTDPIRAEISNDGDIITLLKGFKYIRAEYYGTPEEKVPKNAIICVPTGYVSNGFSVPFPFTAFVPCFGRGVKCAILHDFLYGSQGNVSRKEADTIFYEAMLTTKAFPAYKRWGIFLSVRIFGGLFYKGNIK